jgi:nucleotide sugar dehydrogenase
MPERKTAVAVIGAGKMGLPLACVIAGNGACVIACDANPRVVDAINRGAPLLNEPGVAEGVRALVAEGRLRASTDTVAAVAQSDVVIVIVPVLLTQEREADTSIIESVSAQIAQGMRAGTMVSYETTLPIGGTRRLAPLLERGGLKAGEGFDLVFSPERVKSRSVLQTLSRTPKVVGGSTPAAAERAARFYGEYLGAPVINVGTLEAAEMVKLAGMIYRDANIALANELACYCEADGLDAFDIIRAANTDGEAALLQPGIGVGGHCTPVYPYFAIHDARRRGMPLRMVEEGRRLNEEQPAHAVALLERALGTLEGARVLILGLAFRPLVKEQTCSPAFAVRDALRERGAVPLLHDPLYTPEEVCAAGFEPGSPDEGPAPAALVLNTAHPAYGDLDFPALAGRGLKAVLDGRAFWDAPAVRSAGLIYVGIGRP